MSDSRSTASSAGTQPAAADSAAGAPGRTDWARLRAMDDAEAEANAAADPDHPPASDAWLAAARVVTECYFKRRAPADVGAPAPRTGAGGR